MNSTVTAIENGRIFSAESDILVHAIPWTPHARFAGVFMKNLVSGAQTAGRFSTHLVRVLPGCEIGEHVHATQMEIHDVLAGEGLCVMEDREIKYEPGVSAIIAQDSSHRVCAHNEELYLKATFIPALV